MLLVRHVDAGTQQRGGTAGARSRGTSPAGQEHCWVLRRQPTGVQAQGRGPSSRRRHYLCKPHPADTGHSPHPRHDGHGAPCRAKDQGVLQTSTPSGLHCPAPEGIT